MPGFRGFSKESLNQFRAAASQLASSGDLNIDVPTAQNFTRSELSALAEQRGLEREGFQSNAPINLDGTPAASQNNGGDPNLPTISRIFTDDQLDTTFFSESFGNSVVDGFRRRQQQISQRRAAPGISQTRLV